MRRLAAVVLLIPLVIAGGGRAAAGELRVCADPNNLPFSNRAGEGFENKIIQLIAADMGDQVTYTWWAQRRGFARNTLKAGTCDVWPGVADGVETMWTTRPYYRSTYVFVTRRDRNLKIASLDDDQLKSLTIGVQMVGNDAQNTPPTHALARRGIITNVRGFMLYGDYRKPNPPADIIDAVAQGKIDVAIAWGPMAGYFAAKEPIAMTVSPVEPFTDGPQFPMVFDISMGVRRGDRDLHDALDHELVHEKPQIDAILAEYHVPVLQ